MITGTRYRLTLEINRQLLLARDIERFQTEISTGKRILAPSDDPVGAARVSDIARTQADEAAWTLNLTSAEALSARADTSLSALKVAVDRAKELMLSASNDTLSADNRATIALELRGLAEEIGALRDTRDSRGEPLFRSDPLRIPVGPGVMVEAAGTADSIFDGVTTPGGPRTLRQIVEDAASALALSDPAARRTAINESLTSLGNASTRVSSARGEQGVRGNRIDNLLERLANSGLQLAEERSDIEGANVIELVTKLQARKLSLDAAQAVFARINQNTLFDILR